MRLNKQREYSSKKRSTNTSNNNRAHNTNNNYKKLGKKNNVVLDNNSINSNVRKYPIRKRNTTVNQKLKDTLIDTDTSFESTNSFANKYS